MPDHTDSDQHTDQATGIRTMLARGQQLDQHGRPLPVTCLCCDRRVVNPNPRQPLHLDCWTEHHSDPTGPWPTDHTCNLERTDHHDD